MFSEKLKKARLKAGFTQQELGESIKSDKRIISKFENGYCLPTQSDFEIICKMLGVRTNDLDYPAVATAKTQVATAHKSKTRVSARRFTASLSEGEFAELAKINLKARGFENNKDFLKWAIKKLNEEE